MLYSLGRQRMMNALRLGFFIESRPAAGGSPMLLAKATKPREGSASRGPLFLFPLLLLASGCATPGALAEQATRQRIEDRERDGRVLILEDRVNGLIDKLTDKSRRLEARLAPLEKSVLGPWSRPECAIYSAEAQALFCHRVPPRHD